MHKLPMPAKVLMDLAAIIQAMIEASCSAEQIASVAQSLDLRSTGARRQARYRARKRNESVTPVAPPERNESVTPLARVEDNLLPKKLESKSIYTDCVTEKGDGFDAFVAASPKRLDGAGSARENRRAYDAALAAGATPESLVAAARAYATERAAVVAKDPRQSAYTLTPASWLDRELWRRPLIALAPNLSTGEFIPVKRTDPRWDALEARYRQENGRRPPLHDHWSYPREWFATA